MPGFLASIRILPVGARATGRMLRSMRRRSPVPVSEAREAQKALVTENGRGILGLYHRRLNRIYMLPGLPMYQKAAVFLHELGHHRCGEIGCACYYGTDTMREAHAYAFEIRATMCLGLMRSHHWSMSHICRTAWGLPAYDNYRREAAHEVIGYDDWDEHYRFGYGSPYI